MMRRRGMGRVGRPGLVGTVARTAVVAGTATAVSNKVSQHQATKYEEKAQAQAYQEQQQYGPPPQQQYAQPPQQYAAPPQQEYAPPPQAPPAQPAPSGSDDMLDKLQQLADLKDRGLLTDAEFQAAKGRLLGS